LLSAQVSDRFRFLNSLDGDTKAQFQKMSPENQLTLGSFFSQHPDLNLDFKAEAGSGGFYHVDSGAKTATISIDPTAHDGAIPLIFQHEFGHYIQSRGLGDELISTMLGNKATGEAGLYAAKDASGNPVRLSDGSFAPNAELSGLQARLKQKYLDHGSGNEVPYITPERTIRELAAESAVGLVNPEMVAPRPTIIGNLGEKLFGLGTSPLVNKNFVKGALATLGNGFDLTNNVVGTGVFTGEKRVPAIDGILKNWYGGKKNLGPLDSGDSHDFSPRELAGWSDDDLRDLTGAVDAWKTNAGGKIARGGLRKGRILTLDISGRPRAYLLSFLDQFVCMDFPW
jgi:hypothetical protein